MTSSQRIAAMAANSRPFKPPARHRLTILVPVNPSAISFHAVQLAVNIAAQSEAELVFFHAMDLNLAPFSPINLLGLKTALRREAAEKLEPLLHLARNTGVPATCLVEDGNQGRAILKAASRLQADLIIMGARSRGFFSNFFNRRIREQVLNGAPCPVMVVE